MSRQYKIQITCDRCGLEWAETAKAALEHEYRVRLYPRDATPDEMIPPFDLCKGCRHDFREWLNKPYLAEKLKTEGPDYVAGARESIHSGETE